MSRISCLGALFVSLIALSSLAIPSALRAEETTGAPPTPEVIELFAGVAQGRIGVEVITKDSTEANLLITNKSDKPISVTLPRAFAAKPVLAQFNNNPFNNNNRNNNLNNNVANNANKMPQTLGLGQPPMMNMMNPMANMNQLINPMMNRGNNQQRNRGNQPGFPMMFNIPPEQVAKITVPAVCLDFGKPTPRAAMKYELTAINDASDKPGVAQLCEMLGDKSVDREAIQLAAWHLNNDVSWEKLSSQRTKVAFGTRPRYSKDLIASAKRLAEKVVKPVEEGKKDKTPSVAAL